MAKQKGIMPFTGSLGEVTGRQMNGEFILTKEKQFDGGAGKY